MKSRKQLKSICHNIYKELYKQSTPSADFDELLDNATINEDGKKEIPFMDYEIDIDLFEAIIRDELKKHKLTKWEKASVSQLVYLGCSPRYKNA